ncbi:hypothetical protein AAG570_001737 [Ranatra chinensis]|uniref:Tubulin-specific chaperone E n=1 Tax=Ranatra chinensis TaxID=642074 RepID=A0ABD0YNF2_9HEMI
MDNCGNDPTAVDNVEVGDRIEVNGHRGTVKFVGAVPPTKGIWLGVDWDDPKRGKHNGSYNGVRYFNARYDTSGSLVRLEKAVRGRSIIAAIKEKYGANTTMDKDVVEEVQRAIRAPFLMMVGFDKISEMQSFDSLTIVGIRGYRVNGPGEPGKLRDLCPEITELDLGCNLINSWRSVAEITSQLPHLRFLDLSENRLSLECDFEGIRNDFSELEHLVLSRVEYTWDDVLKCCSVCPKLEKLQVSFNTIINLRVPPPDVLQHLKMLNIEGNNIMGWSEILKLGHIQTLEVLNVSNAGLTNVSFPTPNTYFPSLKYILLSGNFINNWESVSELEKLPSLDELKFRENPVLNGISRETARQILIARVSKLKILNGQAVFDDERRGAEYDYLKQNGRMWLDSSKDENARRAFLVSHPRYPELIKSE